MKRELIITKDNSPTLFVPELDEHYHSVHGALGESMHVFIKAGLQELIDQNSRLNILEMGLGTGLNAWLTLQESAVYNCEIYYHGLEKYPITTEEAGQLWKNTDNPDEGLNQIHLAPWNKWVEIQPGFQLMKEQVDLKQFSSDLRYDLVYYDAFAPSAQPDLWTTEIFVKLFQLMKPGGLLVTYCVKGDVRRSMKAAGFEVEKIPGPPGKREMARAWKNKES